MPKSFEKHKIDRNTVVSTASFGEVAIAAPDLFSDLYKNAQEKFFKVLLVCD